MAVNYHLNAFPIKDMIYYLDSCLIVIVAKLSSLTGNRTRAAAVRAPNPNH